MVCKQIVIDIGDIPECLTLDIPDYQFLHHFLQKTNRTINMP